MDWLFRPIPLFLATSLFDYVVYAITAFIVVVFLVGCRLIIKKIGLSIFVVVACLLAFVGLMSYVMTIPLADNSSTVSSFTLSTAEPTQHTDTIVFESEPSPTPRSK